MTNASSMHEDEHSAGRTTQGDGVWREVGEGFRMGGHMCTHD